MPAVDLDAALLADSVVVAAANVSYVMAASVAADSVFSNSQLNRSVPLGSNAVSNSSAGPIPLLSTDGLSAFPTANSSVTADLKKQKALNASVFANSTMTGPRPDIYRLPKPNVPQPLPASPAFVLRSVPNPGRPADTSISTTPPARRRGI